MGRSLGVDEAQGCIGEQQELADCRMKSLQAHNDWDLCKQYINCKFMFFHVAWSLYLGRQQRSFVWVEMWEF